MPSRHCLQILHWWHCNGFQRVQAKRGTLLSGWVGAETALNTGAPSMQIKPGKFNIFFFSGLQSDGMQLSHASVYASIFREKICTSSLYPPWKLKAILWQPFLKSILIALLDVPKWILNRDAKLRTLKWQFPKGSCPKKWKFFMSVASAIRIFSSLYLFKIHLESFPDCQNM